MISTGADQSRNFGQGLRPGLWSLWDMLEIQALPFMAAVTEMRTLILTIDRITNKNAKVDIGDRSDVLVRHVDKLIAELQKLNSRSALASAIRLKDRLANPADAITYLDTQAILSDIESRFADHLTDIKLFVLMEHEAILFGNADQLLSVPEHPIEGFSSAYPKSAFEIEESAKCIALGRFTASAFHSIRALECGIRAICAYLGVPDPTKPAEKNWGFILKAVADAIDAKWPKKSRIPGTLGAAFEGLYATLDAVKNPWRNATMHVETLYAPHEALHILRCVGMFMLNLSRYCDEQGQAVATSPAR